jgi:release factor glutamine methyltransferase
MGFSSWAATERCMTTGDPNDEIDVQARLSAGRQTFLGVDLLCGTGALVPRPETELLGRTAIARVRAAGPAPRVVDMCCGAGNLASAIAVHAPEARVWAADLTDGCVGWARLNVEALGLGARVTVAQGDLFAAFEGLGLETTIDVVVCNPPYISSGRLGGDRAALLAHEPREAFDGGPYGLSIHQRVIRDAAAFLKPGGWLLFEIGLGQEKQVGLLFERARIYEDIELVANAHGDVRVVCGRVKGDRS